MAVSLQQFNENDYFLLTKLFKVCISKERKSAMAEAEEAKLNFLEKSF